MKAPSFRSDNYGPGAALGCRRAQGRPTLNLVSSVIFVYMLFFADSGEGALTQAVLMGSVIVVTLLLVSLDRPFCDAEGKAS